MKLMILQLKETNEEVSRLRLYTYFSLNCVLGNIPLLLGFCYNFDSQKISSELFVIW